MADASMLTSPSRSFDLRAFAGIVLKRWPIVLLSFLLALGASFFYTSRQARVYRAFSAIVIDTATPQGLGGQFREVVDPSSAWWSGHEYLQTQHQIIQSHSMALSVAHELHLDK